MLEELDIRNFALIDSAHVEFSEGFTVLSGETGAGKSILIGSLAFLLGGRAGVEQIRTGTSEAQVCGTFRLEHGSAFSWLEEHGIEAEDGRVLVRRLIRDSGKSSAWIGGIPVTKADLLDFSSYLVDMHGQHEQQSDGYRRRDQTDDDALDDEGNADKGVGRADRFHDADLKAA